MKVISNPAELQQLITGNSPVLLKFYADWCGDCKALQPVLDDLSKTYEGKIDFVKVNVETHQDLARQYQVKSIPALFFMKDSQIVDKARGVQPKRELEMKLTQLLA